MLCDSIRVYIGCPYVNVLISPGNLMETYLFLPQLSAVLLELIQANWNAVFPDLVFICSPGNRCRWVHRTPAAFLLGCTDVTQLKTQL